MPSSIGIKTKMFPSMLLIGGELIFMSIWKCTTKPLLTFRLPTRWLLKVMILKRYMKYYTNEQGYIITWRIMLMQMLIISWCLNIMRQTKLQWLDLCETWYSEKTTRVQLIWLISAKSTTIAIAKFTDLECRPMTNSVKQIRLLMMLFVILIKMMTQSLHILKKSSKNISVMPLQRSVRCAIRIVSGWDGRCSR